MDLSGSEIASAVAVDVESSDQNKVVFTDEQITTNILSIAQLAVDGSIPVLDAVTKLKQNLTEVVVIGMTKDKWKSLYASVIWILGTQVRQRKIEKYKFTAEIFQMIFLVLDLPNFARGGTPS